MTSGYTALSFDELIDPDLSLLPVMMSGEVDVRLTPSGVVEVRNSDLERFFSLMNRTG